MAERKKRARRGSKLTRSEIVTLRLDPKLRHAVELASRKQRRSISSFVEWAILHALDDVEIQDGITASQALDMTWDVDEADRFVNLAIHFPNLLNHEEEVLWKLIRECGFLWRGEWMLDGDEERLVWRISPDALHKELLREHWETFKQVAAGELPASALPEWTPTREHDIPF